MGKSRWSGWKSRCHTCRGSGQGGRHGVKMAVVVVKLEVKVFEISVAPTANVHSHTGLDANSFPNINKQQRDHLLGILLI